ncbi:MAG: hypothetical protein COA58_15255 [Bacteroidetes bacterium]|nr:MAG: hypothetical protein COA58_15255 [Bacteroidota bacterium]
MKLHQIVILAALIWVSCTHPRKNAKGLPEVQETLIDSLITNWHQNAANANLEDYIGFMDSTCNYIGTDATENWKRDEFGAFCKPYFDKRTTWDFKTLQRSVRVNTNQNTAWFDEILDTHMGTCRGSGALEKVNGNWKLKQYVLSLSIPNESIDDVKKATHVADSVYKHNINQ